MTFSDSMFLFEICIRDLKSYKRCSEFIVTSQFEGVFKICFKKPIMNSASMKGRPTIPKKKCKVRMNCMQFKNQFSNKNSCNIHSQSALVIGTPSYLISNMKQNPLEIYLYSASNKFRKLGFSLISWNSYIVKYISSVHKKEKPSSIQVQGIYNIYDETNTKRIATIDMVFKLLYLGETFTNNLRSMSVDDISDLKTNQNVHKSLLKFNKCEDRESLRNIKLSETNPRIIQRNTYHPLANEFGLSETVPQNKMRLSLSNTYVRSIIHTQCIGTSNLKKSLSCASVDFKRRNILQYVFENYKGSFAEKVYCVGYFTVGQDQGGSQSLQVLQDIPQSTETTKITFKKCDSKCIYPSNSEYSLDLNLNQEADRIKITKCNDLKCYNRNHRNLPLPPDDQIRLDFTSTKRDCCVNQEITEQTEKIIGGITTKMNLDRDQCFCTCECTFGFAKKTTYCNICGGYEEAGDELMRKIEVEMPIRCPVFHKLIDKKHLGKLKPLSTSGSDSKRTSQKATSDKNLAGDRKSMESEKDSKRGKRSNRNDRFKFNYGYKAPQIGHSKCVLPCSGTLDNVPKHMGWLWTAENIPGMKFRSQWKPGATSKHVVRLLRTARNPEQMSKRKRKDTGKNKRPLKRPLLVVHKKEGEFTVTMETMKNYPRPRARSQHPYEDKPAVTYTIGRTEEENRERLKKKERERRRLERAQRYFIQSSFKNMCKEICMKTYQQALGILSDTEDPACMCYPALPTEKAVNINVSCSCSEDESLFISETDSDEWIVEFTPPNAVFNPTYKGKKVLKVNNCTQYTYLDYKVKLLDRNGNPVLRFFKGPDGKQQCSDLGGFWSPDHKWLEINIDGFIAPDGRWAPNMFIGPSGETVDAEGGKFQINSTKWLVIGIDGYVDSQNRWKYYPKKAGSFKRRPHSTKPTKKEKAMDIKYDKSETAWSCFGEVSPKQLSKLGICGHGGDRKLLMSTLDEMLARGEDVKIPLPKTIFHLRSFRDTKNKKGLKKLRSSSAFDEKSKCHHSVPSDKGILAVDEYGNKTYFRIKHSKNKRSQERLATLTNEGISLSSFHAPCFSSFINSEIIKKRHRQRLLALESRNMGTQAV